MTSILLPHGTLSWCLLRRLRLVTCGLDCCWARMITVFSILMSAFSLLAHPPQIGSHCQHFTLMREVASTTGLCRRSWLSWNHSTVSTDEPCSLPPMGFEFWTQARGISQFHPISFFSVGMDSSPE